MPFAGGRRSEKGEPALIVIGGIGAMMDSPLDGGRGAPLPRLVSRPGPHSDRKPVRWVAPTLVGSIRS